MMSQHLRIITSSRGVAINFEQNIGGVDCSSHLSSVDRALPSAYTPAF